MERFSITREDITAGQAYADRMEDAVLKLGGVDVPTPDELLLGCVAARAAARSLEQFAARQGKQATCEIDDDGWPVLVRLIDGDTERIVLPVVGETSMEPRQVWAMRVREVLVTEVKYDVYLSVWLPSVPKLTAPDQMVMPRGTVAGWLPHGDTSVLPLIQMQSVPGNITGGEYRQGKVAQLRSLDLLW